MRRDGVSTAWIDIIEGAAAPACVGVQKKKSGGSKKDPP
jgi:hypothetical protein